MSVENDKKVFTVSRINEYINGLISEDFFLRNIQVSGEVSNLKYHSTGHIYFSLKDKNSRIQAVMFASDRKGLSFKMEEGDKVIVTGRIGVYEAAGTYQIYAKAVKKAGEGDLYRMFLELKNELEEMGMFDPMYKQELPKYAKRIGVVTAREGAVIRDIIRVSKRRNPYVEIILCPAYVQGEYAVSSIVEGIRRLDAMGLDVLIVGRGGGSIEDLWAFNEREVADAIFHASTPIVSAVGHETDTTIADFVADRRAATPSEAAELSVFDMNELLSTLREYEGDLRYEMERSISSMRDLLSAKERALRLLSPVSRIEANKKAFNNYLDRLHRIFAHNLDMKKNDLKGYAKSLDGVSPLKRLSAGYGFIEDGEGRTLSSVSGVKKGDRVNIHMKDGKIRAVAENIEMSERGE